MDVRLPSGKIVKNVPDGMSQDELKRILIQTGAAKPEDFIATQDVLDSQSEPGYLDTIRANLVPLLPTAGALSGAASGALLGATAGGIGAIPGAAIGAFVGGGVGEQGRQMVTGENDPAKVVGTAAFEGIMDVTGTKGIQILADTGSKIGRLVGLGVTNRKKRVVDPDITELQQSLRERGTTLRASQVDPKSALIEGLEAAAEGGIGTKPIFDEIAEAQQSYIDDQISALINAQSRAPQEKISDYILNLIENTRVASSEAYQKVFDELDQLGKNAQINMQGIRNLATRGRTEAMRGLTQKARKIAEKGGKIPMFESEIQQAYDEILKLSPTGDFATYFSKLKRLKNRLTALRGDPATKNKPAVVELTNIVKQFENKMLEQAKKVDPNLADKYIEAMKSYKKSQEVLYSNTAVSAMKQENPEFVASFLVKHGKITPIKDIRKIITEAKKLGVRQGRDIIGGLRRTYMEQVLAAAPGKGIQKINQLDNLLADPEFLRTFNELYPPQTKAAIAKLIKQAKIISRGPGGELALSVRSRQTGAAVGVVSPDRTGFQRIQGAIIAKLPEAIAKYITNAKEIDKLANYIAIGVKAEASGRKVPPQVFRGMLALTIGETAGIESRRQEAEVEEVRREIDRIYGR